MYMFRPVWLPSVILNAIALSCTKLPYRIILPSFAGRVSDVSSEVGIPEFDVQMVQSARSAMETRCSRNGRTSGPAKRTNKVPAGTNRGSVGKTCIARSGK